MILKHLNTIKNFRPTKMNRLGNRGNGGGPAEVVSNGSSLLQFAQSLALNGDSGTPISVNENLIINSNNVGKYGYRIITGDHTINSGFAESNYFTSVKDTESAWVIVNGNLTINGALFTPANRKLFKVLYVNGNLTLSNSSSIISMSMRGANHSGTGDSGGYTAPVDIRVATGTYNSITNPTIPAIGGAGAARRSTDGKNSGGTKTYGTGGGGGGYRFNGGVTASYAGAGAAGTCFSGGAGSGSCYPGTGVTLNSADATENGGAGSAGVGSTPVGGNGNPKGAGSSFTSGTGGVLIVFVTGTISGASGVFRAQGGGTYSMGGIRGGGSGGGVVMTFSTNNPSNSLIVSGGDDSGNGYSNKFLWPNM